MWIRSARCRIAWVLASSLAAAFVCRRGVGEADGRYGEIRRLIVQNLLFGPHLTWSVNVETVRAVRREVTVEDVPVLVRMLGDEKSVVATGASLVLQGFGDTALPALEEAAASPDWKASARAQEALMNLKIRAGERYP